MSSGPPSFALSVVVEVPAARAFKAFLAADDLGYWWAVERSVAVPQPTGPYAVTWPVSDREDDLLGRLGGTLHGTVMEVEPDRALLVADVHWQPPEGLPLGPMALEIRCDPEGDDGHTRVTIRQTAGDDGPRWRRYFALTQAGWSHALDTLKDYLEHEWLYRVKTIKEARS
ncbi:MAG: SRPBCC domain-containing protein [Vicinamibacterales bacterium]